MKSRLALSALFFVTYPVYALWAGEYMGLLHLAGTLVGLLPGHSRYGDD